MLRSHQGARNGCSAMLRSQLGAQNHCSSMLRSHSGAQNLAQACLGATWALRMTARACFASTVLSKTQFNIASKPLRIRNLCSNPASKMLYVRKLRSHSALEIIVRTLVRRPCTFESSNALVSVSLISVALDSAPLCFVHGMHGFKITVQASFGATSRSKGAMEPLRTVRTMLRRCCRFQGFDATLRSKSLFEPRSYCPLEFVARACL